MYREAPVVKLTAAKALLALYQEYEDIYAVEPEHLASLIEEAYGPDANRSVNHVVRVLRMLRRFGFTQGTLMAALEELRLSHAFSPAPVTERQKPVNPHRHQVVSSNWRYPVKWKPLGAEEKALRISKLFLISARANQLMRCLPGGHAIDGFHDMVVVKPSVLAGWLGIKRPYSNEGYAALLTDLAKRVASAYFRENSRHGFHRSLFDLRLSQGKTRIDMLHSTRMAMRQLEMRSGDGPFLVFPGQLGLRWRGSSMERVTWLVENEDFSVGEGWKEFVLPAYAVFFELMADPRRLNNNGVLAMYCAGDVVTDVSHFSRTGISLGFGQDNLHILSESRTRPDDYYGVTTGLIQKF